MFEPHVKRHICNVPPIKFEVAKKIKLTYLNSDLRYSFRQLLENRTSNRSFNTIRLEELGNLFYLVNRTKIVDYNVDGLMVEKRNYPSAGALHTISCLITQMHVDDWYSYNPVDHSFDLLDIDSSKLLKFKQNCFSLVEQTDGFLIWYVCDAERLNGKYRHIESLAFRESGAMAAMQSLVAEALDLSFCILGLHGFKHAATLSDKSKLIGVGTAMVGGSRTT